MRCKLPWKAVIAKPKGLVFHNMRVFHDTFVCQIIWQISTQRRAKKFSKISPRLDWTQNLWIITLMLYWLVSYVLSRRFPKWALLHAPFHIFGVSGWQLNVDLAQFIEHWHDDSEVLSSPRKRVLWKTRMNSCFAAIRRFLVHSDTEYRPIESPVSQLCRI